MAYNQTSFLSFTDWIESYEKYQMKLEPYQLGILAGHVHRSVLMYPCELAQVHNKNIGDESTQSWEKHLAELVDNCPAWSFDYIQLCEAEPVLLDFLIEYYSSES